MRGGNPTATRAQWYDRGATEKDISYSVVSIGPHGVTLRSSYTVGSNVKAFLHYLSIVFQRKTVATAVGDVSGYVVITRSGGTAVRLLDLQFNDNTDESVYESHSAPQILLFPGDKIEFWTYDLSTGGTYNIMLDANISEFAS